MTAKFEYEFGGPVGALATMVSLPIVTLLLTFWASVGRVDFEQILPPDASTSACASDADGGGSASIWRKLTNNRDDASCEEDVRSASVVSRLINSDVLCPSCTDHPTLVSCALVILCWFVFQVMLERVLPCALVKGAPLPDGSGKRLSYRINGHLAFWASLMLLDVAWPQWIDAPTGDGDNVKAVLVFGRAPLTWLYDHYSTLAFVTIIWTILLSTYLYVKSFGRGLLLAAGGDSGNRFYDYFMGRELNQRWGKQFIGCAHCCLMGSGRI